MLNSRNPLPFKTLLEEFVAAAVAKSVTAFTDITVVVRVACAVVFTPGASGNTRWVYSQHRYAHARMIYGTCDTAISHQKGKRRL